jgi:hypothetical protein
VAVLVLDMRCCVTGGRPVNWMRDDCSTQHTLTETPWSNDLCQGAQIIKQIIDKALAKYTSACVLFVRCCFMDDESHQNRGCCG